MATNDLLSRYKKQKKAEAEEASALDITSNNSTSDNPFTLSKYREMKKNNQVNYNTEIISNWFNNADKYMTSVSKKTSSQPNYNWVNDQSDFYSDNFSDLLSQSDYVRTYINSLKGTEQYDSLQKQFDSYNENLRNYKEYLSGLKDFALNFANEEHYNNAIKNIENSETELEKGSKYAAYVSGGKSFDDKKISDFLSNPDNISNPKAFTSGLQKLDNGNGTLKYWETQNRLHDVKNVDTVPTKDQFAQYQKDSDMLFNQDMEKKYGLADYNYNKLVEAYDSTDDYREKEWLTTKAEEVATSEELQDEYDSLTDEYNELYENRDETEAYNRLKEIEDRKARIETLLPQRRNDEKAKKYYYDIIKDNPEIADNVSDYYELQKYKETGGDYNYKLANADEVTVYGEYSLSSEEDRNKIINKFNKLSDEGYDTEELFKYYSRTRELEENRQYLKKQAEFAKKAPVLNTVNSILFKPVAAINTLGKQGTALVDSFTGGDGYYNPEATPMYALNNATSSVASTIDDPFWRSTYEQGVSFADNAIRLGISLIPGMQGAGLAIGSAEVGSQYINDTVMNGGSIENAFKTGIAAAAIEWITERFSIGNLKAFKEKGVDSLKTALVNTAKSMGVEGSQEIAATLADSLADEIINGNLSQLNVTYNNYISQGMTKEEASAATMSDYGNQLVQDFIGGALSGGIFGSGVNAVSYAQNRSTGKTIYEKNNADELVRIGKLYGQDTQAYKLAQEVGEKQANGKQANAKVGQLRSAIIQEASSKISDERSSKISDYVNKSDLSPKEKTIAHKFFNELTLTEEDVNTVNKSKKLQRVVSRMPETRGFNSDNLAKALSATDFTLPKLSVQGVEKIDTAKMTSNEALNAYAKKQNMNEETANAFLKGYDGSMSVDEYALEFTYYNNMGRLIVPYNNISHSIFSLNENTRIEAYKAGLEAYKANAKLSNALTKAQQEWQKSTKGYAKGTVDTSEIRAEKLSDDQKISIKYAQQFAEFGVNVKFFKSEPDSNDMYTRENGSYNSATNTISIDINAGKKRAKDALKNGFMLSTFSHELTHIAEHSTEEYMELRKAVQEAVGADVWDEYVHKQEKLIRNTQKEKYDSMSDVERTEYASKEALAEFCAGMLRESDILEKMAQDNPTATKSFINMIKKLIDKIRMFLKGSGHLTAEAKILANTADDLQTIVDKWEKAVMAGIKNQNAKMVVKNSESKQKNNTAENSSVKNQSRNIIQTEFENNVDAIEKNTYNSDNMVIMGVTPDILQKIGLTPLPLAMTKNHIYSISVSETRAKKEGRYRKNTNYHDLGFNTVKDIYNKISNPLMVIAHPDFTNKVSRDSTHKIIVLVDLSINNNQVIAPISVDYEGMYNNAHIDVNLVATYFDKNNINDLIKEAVALEINNKTGFFYIDKKRTQSLFEKSGYQLPSRLINLSSNIIIRRIDDNVNKKISNITQSQQFLRWFGDWQNHPEKASKVVDSKGKPLVVYHQTAADFTVFSTNNELAGKYDSDTPTGMFFKTTDKDIMLAGGKQMAVYLNARSILTFNNREDIHSYWMKNVAGYSELQKQCDEVDKKYLEEYEKEEIKSDEWYERHYDDLVSGKITDEEAQRIMDGKLDVILDEWKKATNHIRRKQKNLINEYIRKSDFDGIHLINDGTRNGVQVDTYIVFAPTQIKSATDNIGTFDGNNPDVQYSFGGRGAKNADLSLLEKAIKMNDEGKSSEEIRKTTGWFKGYDGKWRFEINDRDMSFKKVTKQDLADIIEYRKKKLRLQDLKDWVSDGTATSEEKQEYQDVLEFIERYENSRKLSDYVKHDKLFEAYPQLKDTNIRFDYIKGNGYYDSGSDIIVIKAKLSYDEQRAALMHEIQHAIQYIEGFAKGGSFEYGIDDYSAYDKYFRTAGEIESRDVADRIDYTDEQRKNIRPDIDRTDVVFADSVTSYSQRSWDRKSYANIDLSTLDDDEIRVYNKRGWAVALFTDKYSNEDLKLLNEKFNELNRRTNQRTDNVLGDGSRVVEVNNKIVLIGDTFNEPEIYCVLAINANNETVANDIKEVIFDEYKRYRQNRYRFADCCKVFESITGKQSIRTYLSEDFTYQKGGKDTGERAILPNSFQNYGYTKQFQNRGGNYTETEQDVSKELNLYDDYDDISFQHRRNSLSNREILANALESTAKTGEEISRLRAYKEGVASLEEDYAQLVDIKKKIKEISFTKGSDRTQLVKLNNSKNILEGRILRKDKALLKLESMEAIQNILEVENKRLVKKWKAEAVAKGEKIRAEMETEIKKLRAEKNAKIEEEHKKGIEKVQKLREAKKTSDYVAKIKGLQKKMVKMATRPTDTDYVPIGFNDIFNDICATVTDAINLDNGSKVSAQLQKLSNRLRDINKSDEHYGDFTDVFSEDFLSQIDELRERLESKLDGGKKIQRKNGKNLGLTLEEATDIYNILHDVYYTIKDATRQLATADNISNYESGCKVIADNNNLTDKQRSALIAVESQFLSAMRLSRVYTGYNHDSELMRHMYALEEGARKKNMFRMTAEKPIIEYAEKNAKAFDSFRHDVITVEYETNDGNTKTVKMTKSQGLQILMSWSREHQPNSNLSHLERGGVTLLDPEQLKKGNKKKAFERRTTIRNVNMSLISAIESKMGEFEHGYRKLAETFFNEVAKEYINETSRILKHRDIATSDYYIPFSVNKDFVKNEIDGLKYDATIEGMGMLKSTVRNAPQPINISGVEQVISRHIEDVGNIYGFAVPIRNFNKMMNIKQFETDSNGNSVPVTSVRDSMRNAWKSDAPVKFFEQVTKDLQTSRSAKNATEEVINDLISTVRQNMITAALVGSISVVIKQAASYPTAGYILSSSSLNKALGKQLGGVLLFKNYSNIIDEIDKYTATHYMRRIGLSSMEIAELGESWISKKLPTKLNPAKWIQGMDCATTALLWEACKEEINGNYRKAGNASNISSEEYFKEVANLYDKVIEQTQPMYDSLHRAEVQKTSHEGFKSVFMFKTQPLQNSGIVFDAVQDAVNNKGDKQLTKNVVKAVSSQIVSAFVFAAMTFAAGLMLRKKKRYADENDEVTVSSIFSRIMTDTGETLFGVVVPIFGSEIITGIEDSFTGKSNDILTDNVVQMAVDFWNSGSSFIDTSVKAIQQAYDGGGFNGEKLFVAFKDLAIDGLALFKGIPLNNYLNILNSVTSRITDMFTGHNSFFGSSSDRQPKEYALSYGKLYLNGNTEKANQQLAALYQEKYDEQIAKGKTSSEAQKAANTSVRTALTNAYKLEYQKAFYHNDKAKQEEIANILLASGYMKWDGKSLSTVLSDWRKSAQEDIEKSYN